MTVSAGPLPALLASLDLARLDGDRFEARCAERERPRVFGGEFLAQVLVAAARTAPGWACHSLHLLFLRPGDPALPVEYRVCSLGDGRRFARREVSGWQRERRVVTGVVSFTTDGTGGEGHQHERMPEVPGPEALTSELEQRRAVSDRMRPEDRTWLLAPRAVEVRQVAPVPLFDPPPGPPVARTWLRAVGVLPDDPLLHAAVLAYASDTTLLDIACHPHGLAWFDSRMEQASLDHALWFHRPFRADDWLLHDQVAPVAAGGRALARGSVFTRDGRLVASVAQEGVSRRVS
jgi:acyl-CoA thioesterase-2